MTDWRDLYSKRDWDGVEAWWRHCQDQQELSELLNLLRRDVPKSRRENGVEVFVDDPDPASVPDEWKGAALILAQGELAATNEGDPEPTPEVWKRERTRIEAILEDLAKADEVTSGDPVLSRSAHARNALDLLKEIDWALAAVIGRSHHRNRTMLADFAADIASLAFHAGSEARSAIGKEVEVHAIRGEKVLAGSQASAFATNGKTKPRTEAVLAAMAELVKEGHSVLNAARIVFENRKLGASAEANRKLWQRHSAES